MSCFYCAVQVKIGLRVLTRPIADRLPTVYRTLGENYNERVLPSIVHETLKAVVAQYNASQEDVALGIIVMVLQTIGSAAILSSLNSGIKDFVLIGNLTLTPQCKEVYPMLEKLYGVHFHIPKYAEFCTAIGAALSYKK